MKDFDTVVTTRRHREIGYCEASDFANITLDVIPVEEKKLIVAFSNYSGKNVI